MVCSTVMCSVEGKLTEAIIVQSRIDEATIIAVQQQMAQQAAFASVPDVVKRVRTQQSCLGVSKVILIRFT